MLEGRSLGRRGRSQEEAESEDVVIAGIGEMRDVGGNTRSQRSSRVGNSIMTLLISNASRITQLA